MARLKLRADRTFIPGHPRLNDVAPAVAGQALPCHAAMLGHELDVPVAWALAIRTSPAWHRGVPGRDHHVRWSFKLSGTGGLVDGLTIISTIGEKADDSALWLAQQVRHLRRVVGVASNCTYPAISLHQDLLGLTVGVGGGNSLLPIGSVCLLLAISRPTAAGLVTSSVLRYGEWQSVRSEFADQKPTFVEPATNPISSREPITR